MVQATVFCKLCLDFYFLLVHWRAITSPYFVIAPQNYIALRYRDINLFKSFYHVRSIPKYSLRLKVVDHGNVVLLCILDGFLQWEAEGIETEQNVALKPFFNGLVEYHLIIHPQDLELR